MDVQSYKNKFIIVSLEYKSIVTINKNNITYNA